MNTYYFLGLKFMTLNGHGGFTVQIVRVGVWVLSLSKSSMWLRANNKLHNLWIGYLPFSVRNGYKKAKKFNLFGKSIAYSVGETKKISV